MANPSKRTPWVVEMYSEQTGKWYAIGAYRNQDEAEANRMLALHKAPTVAWNVRNAFPLKLKK